VRRPCLFNEPEIATLLVDRGANLDIFEASAMGYLQRVKHLVEDQPELANAFSADGFQALGGASFLNPFSARKRVLAVDSPISKYHFL
jgi:hypothetical protein